MTLDTVGAQPIIEAGRFVMRPLRPADAPALIRHASNRRLAESTRSIPHPFPEDAAAAFIDRALAPDRTEDIWALDGSAGGKADLLGVIALERMDRDQSEVGYWVAPELWNTGLASEALRAMIAANPQGCQTMFAEVFQDNPGSARVLTNCGFAYLGDAESPCVARGHSVPTWTYLRKLY